MEFTTQRNNLYDCVINEIEKLNEYQRVLTKFSNEDIHMVEEFKNDPDLIGFIHLKSHDIITDKMLRAFVNIEHAVERTYRTVMKELQSDKTAAAKYTKEIFFELYRHINQNLDMAARGTLYNKEVNRILYDLSFMEYIVEADLTMRKFIAGYHPEDRETVSTEQLIEATDRCYNLIKKFFNIMRSQLESKPYYNNSIVVMKHVFYITTMISDVATTVTIE